MARRSFIKENGTIKVATLHTLLPWQRWLTVYPFVFIYLPLIFTYGDPEFVWGEETYAEWNTYIDFGHAVSFPFVIFGHAFFALLTVWSVKVRAYCRFQDASSVDTATHVLLLTQPHKGENGLVELLTKRTSSANPTPVRYFVFQERKWTFDAEAKVFTKQPFPTKLPVSDYINAAGLSTDAERDDARDKFGTNSIVIKVPAFKELFVDHAFAPFFVFQMFCVLLWCLDEYWMYSLFTGFMMCVLEATVVTQRVRNMNMLRSMGEVPVIDIKVLRKGKFELVKSSELLPMDVVTIPMGLAAPCDLLVTKGMCVVNEAMLTGESTPQMKDALEGSTGGNLNLRKDHIHNVVYSGTHVLTSQSGTSGEGATGVVLKTGFETKQGKLIRTIVHSQSRISENSGEAFGFIACLLVCAVAAVYYVIERGLADPSRSRWKLFLTCTQILTSVVPPELPMELSLAVNTSLVALFKLKVFCTEPFRIPFAGKVDTCCFDKTGTLTTDEMVFSGVDMCDKSGLRAPDQVPLAAERVLASCHSLVLLDKGELAGDSMERAALDSLKWKCSKADSVTKSEAAGKGTRQRTIRTHHRFAFTPALKRMSCVISDEGDRLIVCKGAPETLESIMSHVPPGYKEKVMHYTTSGYRVIALAARDVGDRPTAMMKRDEEETNLSFAGLAVFACPLKADCKEMTLALREGGHRCVMITGDNVFTAIAVARDVGIVTGPTCVADVAPDKTVHWLHRRELADEPKSFAVPQKGYMPCVNGEVLSSEAMATVLKQYSHTVAVWARCAPQQKEGIITSLNSKGHHTMMAGDGTNDVGALKQAHLGIAVLNSSQVHSTLGGGDGPMMPGMAMPGQLPPIPPPPPEVPPLAPGAGVWATAKHEFELAKRKKILEYIDRLEKAHKEKAASQRAAVAAAPGQPAAPAAGDNKDSPMAAAMAAGGDMDDGRSAPMIRLGDASIAAPFTCKSHQLTSICDIIRLGRCTLVTTLQMYKILALNCLITAYSMSVLHSDGIKFGDKQMMLSGLLIAVCFLFLSRSQPLPKLSAERPFTSVFHPYMVLSIIGQFAFHLWALVQSVDLVKNADSEAILRQRAEVDDIEFKPSLLNSIVFMMTTMMTVMTFAVNYRGHPFMTGLRENKPMMYGLMILGGSIMSCALEIEPGFNEYLEITPYPSEAFKSRFIEILLMDAVGVLVVEKVLLAIFRHKPSKKDE